MLPPLPKKHFWKSSTNPSLIDERKELLEKYLQGLKKIDGVVSSDIMRMWLSEANNVRAHLALHRITIAAQCALLLHLRQSGNAREGRYVHR